MECGNNAGLKMYIKTKRDAVAAVTAEQHMRMDVLAAEGLPRQAAGFVRRVCFVEF